MSGRGRNRASPAGSLPSYSRGRGRGLPGGDTHQAVPRGRGQPRGAGRGRGLSPQVTIFRYGYLAVAAQR